MENKYSVSFGQVTLAHTDDRRSIFEANNLNGYSYQKFVIHSSQRPIGQHYHKKKSELFHFSKGFGVVSVALVDDEGKIIGEIKYYEVFPGSVIFIPAMHTHRFDMEVGSEFDCFSSVSFDPSDPDLNPSPIDLNV